MPFPRRRIVSASLCNGLIEWTKASALYIFMWWIIRLSNIWVDQFLATSSSQFNVQVAEKKNTWPALRTSHQALPVIGTTTSIHQPNGTFINFEFLSSSIVSTAIPSVITFAHFERRGCSFAGHISRHTTVVFIGRSITKSPSSLSHQYNASLTSISGSTFVLILPRCLQKREFVSSKPVQEKHKKGIGEDNAKQVQHPEFLMCNGPQHLHL